MRRSLSRQACMLFLLTVLDLSAACIAPPNNWFAAAAQTANSRSCMPVPDGNISQAQVAQYESVEAGLKDKEAQANHDYANDKLRCKADPKPSACLMTAQKKFQNAETGIQQDRDTNDGNRQRAEIEAGAARDQCNVTGDTPAEKQENLRHFQALIALKIKNVDIQTKYNIDKLECQIYSVAAAPDSGGAISSDKRAPSDNYNTFSKPAGCTGDAEKAYAADQVSLQVDTNDENFLHTKNMAAIQK